MIYKTGNGAGSEKGYWVQESEEEGCGNNGPGTVGRMGLLGTRMKCRGWVGEGTEYSVGECAWERT